MTEQAGAPRPGCPADSGDVATDAELCRRARRGQQPAFEELRRRHVQPAWRLAQTLIADGDDADRAAREAFIRAIRAGGRSEVAAEPFQTRLLASVYRHAVEDRHPTARPAMGRDRPSHGHVNGAPAIGSEDQRLGHALAALPERWRAALWLTDVERMPLHQVAAVIGTPSPVAAQLVTRARGGLAQRFRRAGPHGNLPDVPAALRAGTRPLPAESNALALARWKRAQSGHRYLVGRSRDWRSERTRRQLTAGAAAVLALGLIGLGVIDQGAFGGSTPGGAVAAPLASHQFTGPPGTSLELAGLLLGGPGGLAPFGVNPVTVGTGTTRRKRLEPGPRTGRRPALGGPASVAALRVAAPRVAIPPAPGPA